MSMEHFAFIGTRELNADQRDWIGQKINWLSNNHPNATLHTGAALGTDQRVAEFWLDGKHPVVLHLPWPNYENNWRGRLAGNGRRFEVDRTVHTVEMEQTAELHHDRWGACSQGVRKLHTRNVAVIEPCSHVFAVPGSAPLGGGTAMGIKIARHLGKSVEVYDAYPSLNRDWSKCGCPDED